jgi:hypothetical protein
VVELVLPSISTPLMSDGLFFTGLNSRI